MYATLQKYISAIKDFVVHTSSKPAGFGLHSINWIKVFVIMQEDHEIEDS